MADEVALAAGAEDVEGADSKPGLSEAADDGAGFEAFATDAGVGGEGEGEGTGGGDVEGIKCCVLAMYRQLLFRLGSAKGRGGG